MPKYTSEKINELANQLVDVSYLLRTDPTEASTYVGTLRSVLEQVEELGGEQLMELHRG